MTLDWIAANIIFLISWIEWSAFIYFCQMLKNYNEYWSVWHYTNTAFVCIWHCRLRYYYYIELVLNWKWMKNQGAFLSDFQCRNLLPFIINTSVFSPNIREYFHYHFVSELSLCFLNVRCSQLYWLTFSIYIKYLLKYEESLKI